MFGFLIYLTLMFPQDDEGGDGRIAEAEYDALNDETFGSAINGDWEEAHETMVRLGGNGERVRKRPAESSGITDFADHGNGAFLRHPNPLSSAPSSSGSTPAPFNAPFRQSRHIGDSDLELNLSSMKLDDVDLSTFAADSEASGLSNRINLDSGVWGSQPFPNNQHLFREPMRSAFKPQQQQQPQQHHLPPQLQQMKPPTEANANFPLAPQGFPKITTLEDIERNMIIQQSMPKQQQQQQQQNQQQAERKMFDDFSLGNRQQVATPTMLQQQQLQQQQLQQLQLQQQKQQSQQQPPQQAQHKGEQKSIYHSVMQFRCRFYFDECNFFKINILPNNIS